MNSIKEISPTMGEAIYSKVCDTIESFSKKEDETIEYVVYGDVREDYNVWKVENGQMVVFEGSRPKYSRFIKVECYTNSIVYTVHIGSEYSSTWSYRFDGERLNMHKCIAIS